MQISLSPQLGGADAAASEPHLEAHRRHVAWREMWGHTMMIDRLLWENRDQILRLAAARGIRNVRVFGSGARGDDGPDSDIDLLVDIEPDSSLLERLALRHELEGLLGRKIDLVAECELHWYIRDGNVAQAMPL